MGFDKNAPWNVRKWDFLFSRARTIQYFRPHKPSGHWCNATTFAMSVYGWIFFPKCRYSNQGIKEKKKPKYRVFHSGPPPPPPLLRHVPFPKRIENVWMQTCGGPRDTDRRPSRRGWRGRTRWGRRCVRTSLSSRCGCATARAATLPSGSPRNSRRSWCSPSRPGTRSRTPRRAPACAWRCSSE